MGIVVYDEWMDELKLISILFHSSHGEKYVLTVVITYVH